MAGFAWKSLTADGKRPYFDKAAALKAEHMKKYPDYRFDPKPRAHPKASRKMKRRSQADIYLSQRIADIVTNRNLSEEQRKAEIARIKALGHTGTRVAQGKVKQNRAQIFAPISSLPHIDVTPFRSPPIQPPRHSSSSTASPSWYTPPLALYDGSSSSSSSSGSEMDVVSTQLSILSLDMLLT